jgi:hypothetical protein
MIEMWESMRRKMNLEINLLEKGWMREYLRWVLKMTVIIDYKNWIVMCHLYYGPMIFDLGSWNFNVRSPFGSLGIYVNFHPCRHDLFWMIYEIQEALGPYHSPESTCPIYNFFPNNYAFHSLLPHLTPRGHDFVLCQKAFMYILASLTQWYLKRRIFKYFSYIKACKNNFPYCGPHMTPRGQTCFCTMSESFHVNFSFSGSVVLEKKIVKIFSYINTCKNSLPYYYPTLGGWVGVGGWGVLRQKPCM